MDILQDTAAIAKHVAQLAETRDELLAEVATLEETLPSELRRDTAEGATGTDTTPSTHARAALAANARGSLLYILSHVAGGTPIHPAHLPAIIKSVNVVLAARAHDGPNNVASESEQASPALIGALRDAVLAVVAPQG